jgi:uncharacterized membrane protein YfcA
MPELNLESLIALLPFVGVGFLAQLVDGALGMAFGVITNTMLVSVLGLAPARASASVHLVEAFTTAASAISHTFHKNVNWKLFVRLVGPGMIGGVTGAYLLSNIDAKAAKPFVMAYLAGIGVYLLWRAWRLDHGAAPKAARVVEPLGLIGGFLDAAGGGGWGPVVTSNLLVQGTDPRTTIGTVNTAEFFLTVVISLTFIMTIGLQAFTIATVGILIGGLMAAPLGAVLAKRIEPKKLLLMVGCVLTMTSLFSLYKALA